MPYHITFKPDHLPVTYFEKLEKSRGASFAYARQFGRIFKSRPAAERVRARLIATGYLRASHLKIREAK